jgi:hypothetical protein
MVKVEAKAIRDQSVEQHVRVQIALVVQKGVQLTPKRFAAMTTCKPNE